MSVRTLKRKLKSMNLRRKNSIDFEDQDHIRQVIRDEMSGPGSLGGYRTIWHALRLRHQLHVPRSFVANVMKEIDPDGVEARKKRKLRRRTFFSEGPNYSWHNDGMYTCLSALIFRSFVPTFKTPKETCRLNEKD